LSMKVIKIIQSFLKRAFFGIKVFWKLSDINAESASSSDIICVDIPSVIDALTPSNQGNASSHSSSKMSFSTSGGNMIIPNLALGERRMMGNTDEIVEFEYWGKVINGSDKMDSMTKEDYPFYLCPQTGRSILAYKQFEGAVNGVSEPRLFSKLQCLKEIEPDIEILKDVSLPIKNRNYGYKPDIAIVWKSKGICIDVEVDEPYDILSRKPIHYLDGECSDYLRNAYFLENGWYVIRVTEEQVIKKIDDVYNYISRLVFSISEDERFKVDSDIKPLKRWTREEAQRMAKNNYREGYLEAFLGRKLEIVQPTTTEDGEINAPNGYGVEHPQIDILEHSYKDLSDRLKDTAEGNHYLRIKKSGNGYEYVTTKEHIDYYFHGIKLFDVVENKEYYLSFADIDSYKGKEDIKIENGEKEWPYIMYEAIVNCRPIHIVYDKTSELIPTERTVIYLVPYLKYTEGAQRFIEEYSKMDWLKMCSLHFYSDLCNLEQYSECSGYCLYRNDLRAFNSYRILEGYVYDCFKPLTEYDTEHVLQVLEKGDGRLAEIIYSHFTDEKKGKYYNVANNAHALVMQGKTEEALKQYRLFPKDKSLSNGQTWNEAIFEDIDSYIAKDIHKEKFKHVKKELELLNT